LRGCAEEAIGSKEVDMLGESLAIQPRYIRLSKEVLDTMRKSPEDAHVRQWIHDQEQQQEDPGTLKKYSSGPQAGAATVGVTVSNFGEESGCNSRDKLVTQPDGDDTDTGATYGSSQKTGTGEDEWGGQTDDDISVGTVAGEEARGNGGEHEVTESPQHESQEREKYTTHQSKDHQEFHK